MRTKNCLNKNKKYNVQIFNNYNYKILDINLTTYSEIIKLCPCFNTEEEVRNYIRLKGVFKHKSKIEKYANLTITKLEHNVYDFYET